VSLNHSHKEAVRGSINGMPRDDDLDYTILNLGIAERQGRKTRSEDVAEAWLEKLPYLQVYTAERQAYRNLVEGFLPPTSASRFNPYREWIGAQIRADLWGYISPGNPTAAARLAWTDASISHTKNGLYGAMFFAALIAAALGEATLEEALDRAAGVIPPRSRFAAMVRTVRDWHAEGRTWNETLESIYEEYGPYHWIHTINNAAAVIAALLHGEGDFSRTIGLAVTAGWDTDCNGATAGSVLGALFGTTGIPDHRTAPLRDSIRTAVVGAGDTHISTLAARTALLAGISVAV
jgi:ADP-ribosylglycohydrolase